MAQTSNRWIRALVFVLAAVLAGMIWMNRDRFGPVEPGRPAPAYEVYSLIGDTLHIADYKGSVVVLNVWATWCAPCVREMPALERLHQKLGPRGLEIIAVSVDTTPDADVAVRNFRDRFGLTFPLLRDPTGDIQTAYAVSGLPTTFIIDRRGRIQQKLLGAREWDGEEMVAQLEKLLEK
jgi:cytochrome c biogenesis protein CcmG, thiol:disulfide interchange protein DsbE